MHKQSNWDNVIISVSGGKDSAALMAWAVGEFPREKLACVHALIDIDWAETRQVVENQCKFFNLPLVFVQAVDKNGKDKGFLDQLTAPRIDRKTKEVKQYQFPDMGNRWCTSILKTGPIDKYVRSLKGKSLVLIGERAEESPKRAALAMWRPDIGLSVNGRTVVKYSPILHLKESEVWAVIDSQGIPKHPCYSWGVSRASCAICIFSSNAEIKIAAQKAPEIVARYLVAESKIDHTFRYKPKTKKREAIKQTVADILAT